MQVLEVKRRRVIAAILQRIASKQYFSIFFIRVLSRITDAFADAHELMPATQDYRLKLLRPFMSN